MHFTASLNDLPSSRLHNYNLLHDLLRALTLLGSLALDVDGSKRGLDACRSYLSSQSTGEILNDCPVAGIDPRMAPNISYRIPPFKMP